MKTSRTSYIYIYMCIGGANRKNECREASSEPQSNLILFLNLKQKQNKKQKSSNVIIMFFYSYFARVLTFHHCTWVVNTQKKLKKVLKRWKNYFHGTKTKDLRMTCCEKMRRWPKACSAFFKCIKYTLYLCSTLMMKFSNTLFLLLSYCFRENSNTTFIFVAMTKLHLI